MKTQLFSSNEALLFQICLSNARFREYLKLVSEIAWRTLKLPSKAGFARRWANIAVRADRCRQTLQSSAMPFAYITGAVAKVALKIKFIL